MSYGGGGPLHAAGYSKPLDFRDVLIPQWAAAFSAFGCATADYSYRYDQSLDIVVQPDMSNADEVAVVLNDALESLADRTVESFERDGIDQTETEFRPGLRMQYAGMLDDLEIQIPQDRWEGGLDGEDVEAIVDIYETEFAQVFQRAAKSPEQGYMITMGVGTGVAPSPKPSIPEEPLRGETPPEAAAKGERPIYYDGDWHDANIWTMRAIEPGNVIEGPAVIEAPATTILVPPEFEAPLDEHRIYHLQRGT
jgi:N-methylhydantoinase A/acetone carboxylase, beta subunit